MMTPSLGVRMTDQVAVSTPPKSVYTWAPAGSAGRPLSTAGIRGSIFKLERYTDRIFYFSHASTSSH